jgi:hypothetical protein
MRGIPVVSCSGQRSIRALRDEAVASGELTAPLNAAAVF